MLNLSCIFSVFVSRLFVCISPFCFQDFGSFSLSLFWIFYHVGSLSLPLWFDLVGIYPVPLPVGYFCAFSSCLYWCVWGGLSVFWQFVVPLFFGGSSLQVGLDMWLVKVSWLEKLASVYLCSGGWSWIFSLWSAMKCPVVSFEVSVGLVWLWAACILMLRVMFLHCWRICMAYLALKLVGSWVEVGFSVRMEAFGWAFVN